MEKKNPFIFKYAENLKQLRAERTRNNICSMCGRNRIVEGRNSCAECLKRQSDRTKRIYYERKAAGICVKCGKHPAAPGKVKCTDCAQMYKANYEGGNDGI